MKLWINFYEEDIKKRKDGWKEGDDWETQIIFEKEQETDNCNIIFENNKVIISFDNGQLTMTREEFGRLFI